MGRKRPRSRAKQSNIASKDAADVVIEERGQGGTDEDLDSCKTPAAKRRATSQTSGRDLDDSESAREGDMETVNIASASSDLLESICSSLIGRKKQVETLIQLFEEPAVPVHSSLFIYGHSGTGKTTVVQSVLSALKIFSVYINCAEFYTQRSLLEEIMDQLSGHVLSSENNYVSQLKCENMAAFTRQLPDVLKRNDYNDRTVCIILDKLEYLRTMELTLIPAFLRLQELCSRKITVVMLSCLTWEKFNSSLIGCEPLIVHFPNYSKKETIAILSKDCVEESMLVFYQTFLGHVWNLFSHVCDIKELRHICAVLYPKYCSPVLSGEVEKSDTKKLWSKGVPHFKAVMEKVYLHETTRNTSEGESQESSRTAVLELPLYSKYLLVAAYLASYNPANTDKRFFAKERYSKKKITSKQSTKMNRQLMGPKPFPLDRLMAIFYSIVGKPVLPTSSLFSQVASLVTLQFVSQMSSAEYLDAPRYKCLVTLDVARSVARSVGLDLFRYLYDYI